MVVAEPTYEGETLNLTHITRSDMGPYLCIANNTILPIVSKRINVEVHCKYYNNVIFPIVSMRINVEIHCKYYNNIILPIISKRINVDVHCKYYNNIILPIVIVKRVNVDVHSSSQLVVHCHIFLMKISTTKLKSIPGFV